MRALDFRIQALAIFGLSLAHSVVPAPIAVTRNRTISGVHCEIYRQDFFLGIPYAQPPLQELRFRNPQSFNYTFGGIFNANQYSPECVGYGVRPMPYWRCRTTTTDDKDRAINLAIRHQKTA